MLSVITHFPTNHSKNGQIGIRGAQNGHIWQKFNYFLIIIILYSTVQLKFKCAFQKFSISASFFLKKDMINVASLSNFFILPITKIISSISIIMETTTYKYNTSIHNYISKKLLSEVFIQIKLETNCEFF